MDRKLGHKVSRLFLKWLAHKCKVYDLFSVSFDEAHHCYEACDAEYAQLKHRAPELWHKFLLSLANNEAGDVDTASQQAAQHTLHTECQHKEARHIKQVLGKASGGAISCIKVATADGLIEVDSQADVEHYTMDMCLAQFCLMESTPLMIEPLCSELGFLGITNATCQILAGTYQPPPGVADITHKFIATLTAPAPLGPTDLIPCQITRLISNSIGGPYVSAHPLYCLAYIMGTTKQLHGMTFSAKYMPS